MSAVSSLVVEAVALISAADLEPSRPTSLSAGGGLSATRTRAQSWPTGSMPIPNDVSSIVPVTARAWRKHPAVIEYVDIAWEDDRLVLAPWAADTGVLSEVVASGMPGRFARKMRKGRPEPAASELLDAWRAEVPLSYAKALPRVPLPLVTEVWEAGIPLEYAAEMYGAAA